MCNIEIRVLPGLAPRCLIGVIYDFLLDADFRLRCMDGEIESFDCPALTELRQESSNPDSIKTGSRIVCTNLLK